MAGQPKSERFRLQDEVNQTWQVRADLYSRLEQIFGMSAYALFTSFVYPVNLDDSDADMLEEALRARPPEKGVLLILDSPGGMTLAAERIIRICREYSPGPFEVAVPKMAKSAATMVCLGCDRVWMGPTSELGPIDPQMVFKGPDDVTRRVAIQNIIRSYEDLMEDAANCRGNVEPYLLQLARYDAREIEELRAASDLTVDVAVKALANSMMSGKSKATIRSKIASLTEAAEKKSHGRPIFYDEAKRIGLRVRLMKKRSQKWNALRRLYTRLDWLVTNRTAKILEAYGVTFTVST